MARLTMERFMQLQEMGREPISLPDKIYFGGNEVLQKTPGNHHMPQFRKTGTYNHPSLRAQRKRVAMDRAKRLINGKMTEVELRKVGGMPGLQAALAEFGLKIDAEQMEVAMMNATALDEDGKAKHEMREEQKMLEMAKLGMKYTPGDSVKTVDNEVMTPKKLVAAVARANATKIKPEDDLSSLKDESEKDGNNISADEQKDFTESSGVIETDESVDVDVNFKEGI